MTYAVATFYRFVPVPDLIEERLELQEFCRAENLVGTILLAEEGVNGTVAGEPGSLGRLLDEIVARFGIERRDIKHSSAVQAPFRRMRVRIRPELITLRAPEANPAQRTGRHVGVGEWNRILADPDVLVLDTRNHYETRLGTFQGATIPPLDSFTDFKSFVAEQLDPAIHRRVAMFCTGGIRCEKASSYMLSLGFEDVVQLEGGILRYLEVVPLEESRWVGDCFVFDGRTALGAGLAATDWNSCFGCGHLLDEADRQRPEFEEGVSCPRCHAGLSGRRAVDLRRRHAARTS